MIPTEFGPILVALIAALASAYAIYGNRQNVTAKTYQALVETVADYGRELDEERNRRQETIAMYERQRAADLESYDRRLAEAERRHRTEIDNLRAEYAEKQEAQNARIIELRRELETVIADRNRLLLENHNLRTEKE